jgi:hypothetical protein
MVKILPIIIFMSALPLVGIVILWIARRSKTIPNLALALLLSGITGAIFSALIAFMVSPMPVVPHEIANGRWYPVLWACLFGLYVGFGIGVVIAAIIVSPILLFKTLKKNQMGKKTGADVLPDDEIG